MKNILMTIFAVAAAGAAFAGADQGAVNLSVSTQGPDYYADGKTLVVDGESYALVWTRTGATFAGITVEGKAVGSQDDNHVIAISDGLAKDGHCPRWNLALPATMANRYVGKGAFSVHLLDTRTADGTPGGKNAGLNAHGSSQTFNLSAGVTVQTVASGATSAENATVVPDTISAPKIKSIEVKDGVVRLTVEKTSKLLRYGVSSGKNPAVLAADTSFPRKDGNDDADIMIEAPAKGASEFFKVGRAPLK